MKTLKFDISLEQANKFVDQLFGLGYEPLCISGSLLDNYICNLGTDHNLKLGCYKMRKYVLIREVYQNEWTSALELELTDDDSVYEKWIKNYEDYIKEMDG